jgi:GNAT superfamily N-acetyltransferase
VKTIAPGVGSLKRMWGARSARGLGLGRRLLAALETEARALYRSAGYAEVPAFNADPYAHHWFEKRLT